MRASAQTKGSSARADTLFTTLTAPPTNAITAFAAPRTDTSARLNAYINPQGETLTYRFEVSEDEGASWQSLPDRTDVGETHKEIVVGEELTGLRPATEYRYRLAFAANHCNPAEPDEFCPAPGLPASERTLTTRSTAEIREANPPSGSCPNETIRQNQHSTYLLDCRGFELINNPDKGDQNVSVNEFAQANFTGPPATPDGENALWGVNGGAPGGNSANGAHFLAQRTGPTAAAPSGWRSSALEPSVGEQVGEGLRPYAPRAATPDLSRFIEEVTPPANSIGERFFVRLDRSGHRGVARPGLPRRKGLERST